jgi:hypothetical protein
MEVYSYELFESMTYKRKKIKEALHNGFVVFEYKKKDGTHRKAFGTLKSNYILQHWKPKGEYCYSIEVCKSLGYIQYWDLERNNFRQFRLKDAGIDIVETFPTYSRIVSAYPQLAQHKKKPKYPIYKKLKVTYPKDKRK